MTTVYEQCSKCNHTTIEGTKYCPNCGAALSAAEGDGFFAQGKHYFSEAADELVGAARDAAQAVKSPKGKKVAAGAAIGAIAGLPIIGWATGALAGAGIVAYRQGKAKADAQDVAKPAPKKQATSSKTNTAKSKTTTAGKKRS